MELELNCTYTWINKTHESLQCTPEIGMQYPIIQVGVVVILGLLVFYGLMRFIEWWKT